MTQHNPQPKRHHFVPEMLQKRFTDESGLLYFFNKNTPENGIRPVKPGNLHVERHLYSLIRNDGTKDTTLEQSYSLLEGDANRLITEMLLMVDQSICPALSEEQAYLWAVFVYEQWRRVPDVHDKLMPLNDTETLVSDAIDEYESIYGRALSDETRKRFLDPKYLVRFRQNARVGALSRRSEKVIDALRHKGLFFAVCGANQGFVLGSAPVLKLTTRGINHLPDPSVEVWLPVAKNVAAVLGGGPFDGKVVPINRSTVRMINREIAKKSTVFATHDPRLTRGIANKLS